MAISKGDRVEAETKHYGVILGYVKAVNGNEVLIKPDHRMIGVCVNVRFVVKTDRIT